MLGRLFLWGDAAQFHHFSFIFVNAKRVGMALAP
jgi:hypothetical protein